MNIRDMIRKMTVVSVSVGLCSTLAAVDFPGAGGDLADKDAWGGTLPSSSDGVRIVNAGTYTASDDIGFSAVTVTADQVTFDLAQDGNHSVGVSGGDMLALRFLTPANAVTTFKGGVWDCLSSSPYVAASGDKKSGRHVQLADGCVWTNVARVTVARSAACGGAELSLTGGSRIYTQQLFVGYTSNDNVLRITDGSSVVLDGYSGSSFYMDNSAPAARNAVFVSGEGSSLSVLQGASYLGNVGQDARMEVTDGAKAYFTQLIIGNKDTSTGATLFVGNGATLEADALTARSVGGESIVSNATLKVPEDFRIGGYSNFTFRVMGAQTAFPIVLKDLENDGGPDVFCATSSGNALWLEDSAAWEAPLSPKLFYNSKNVKQFNTFRVSGGARFVCTNTVNVGERVQANSRSNTWEIVDGGIVDIPELRLSGIGNRMIIDNASLYCTNKYSVSDQYLRFGYRHPKSTGDPADDGLTLRGEKPRVLSTSTVQFLNGATLRYEIPQAGYAKDYCPVQSSALSFDSSSCTMEIEADDWARETGGKLKLATVTSSSGFKNGITNVIKAVSLPADCSLYIEGKSLFLKCPRRSGLTIILR